MHGNIPTIEQGQKMSVKDGIIPERVKILWPDDTVTYHKNWKCGERALKRRGFSRSPFDTNPEYAYLLSDFFMVAYRRETKDQS